MLQSTGQVRFNVIVKADTDAVTAVTVNASMRGELLGPLSAPWLTCFSAGVLEAEIANAVLERIGRLTK